MDYHQEYLKLHNVSYNHFILVKRKYDYLALESLSELSILFPGVVFGRSETYKNFPPETYLAVLYQQYNQPMNLNEALFLLLRHGEVVHWKPELWSYLSSFTFHLPSVILVSSKDGVFKNPKPEIMEKLLTNARIHSPYVGYWYTIIQHHRSTEYGYDQNKDRFLPVSFMDYTKMGLRRNMVISS